MYSSTFGKGWVGMSACPLVVLACESLHVCTVCIWRCEHARFCVEGFYALYMNFHSFIHSLIKLRIGLQCQQGVVGGSADSPFSVSTTLTTIFIVTRVQSAALLKAQSFPQLPITT